MAVRKHKAPTKKTSSLRGAFVVRDLTAGAEVTKAPCNLALRLASPMGPECGASFILHDVYVQRVKLIGPAKLVKVKDSKGPTGD
jgi:hypothetical protein